MIELQARIIMDGPHNTPDTTEALMAARIVLQQYRPVIEAIEAEIQKAYEAALDDGRAEALRE